MKKLKLLAVLGLALASITAEAKNVKLAWDYPDEPNVIAFNVTYWREGAGELNNLTVGPAVRDITINFLSGSWDVQAVAVGNTGVNSEPSNLVDVFVPIPPANLRIVIE